MNVVRVNIVLLLILLYAASVALATQHLPEERGKVLFNDPKFAGGKRACSSCHPDGKGLEKAAARSEESLEETVNGCIVKASGGKAIASQSSQMKDIIAYIKSIGAKKTK